MRKEEFDKFIDYLQESSALIVVEGKGDKSALIDFGIDSRKIKTLSKPIYSIVEILVKKGKECIILTDLDKKGKELYARINSELSMKGIYVDKWPREFLFKTQLRQIEGMRRYYEGLK